jgi:hypothetical protein
MNRQMWVVAFLAVVLTSATLAAQTSGSPSSQSQSGTVTLTGCLQKGSQSGTAGTSGTGSTSGSATSSPSSSSSGREQFILTNAQMGSSSRSSASGTSGSATGSSTAGTSTSGTSGSASSASSGSRYILDGQESELTKHVGEKVEITGTLASAGGAASGGASSSGTSGTATGGTSSTSSASGQRVRVQSVKTVASTCSQ